MPVLRALGVRKRFGGVVALDGADFSLEPGEVHALIGSNGCGKSTLCKIIAGAVAADGGTIELDGKAVAFANPRAAAAAGIGAFYQDLSLIGDMTVAENIYLGREPRRHGWRVDRGARRRAAAAALAGFGDVLGEAIDPDDRVRDLTPDQNQVVEILKVLSEDPRILVFDEATAALDRRQVERLFARIRALKADGRSIVFITHRMDEMFELADRVTVLRNGQTVLVRPTAETSRDEVVEAMVGAAPQSSLRRNRAVDPGAIALQVDDLHARRLAGVSLKLHRGEVVGLGGLHRQGQSELLQAIFGALRIEGGEVRAGGQRIETGNPRQAIRRSIAYVSGDRARRGVLAIRPIFENLIVSLLARDRSVALARSRLAAAIAPFVEGLKLKFASLDDPVAALSGGNQQKVVIGRWLATRPQALLLDDPTKGIDIQTKVDLYRTIDELCGQGVAILLYSSDDEELLTLADRILVFNAGRVVGELAGESRNRLALYRAAYGEGARAAHDGSEALH
jgi:ribose transport system ATP-binding protein